MKKILSVLLILIFLCVGCCACGVREEIKKITTYLSQEISQYFENPVIVDESVELSGGDTTQLFSYQQLNEEQQRIYRIMLNAAKTMKKGWIHLGKCTGNYSADVNCAYQALSGDYPEIFWLPYTYLISNQGNDAHPDVRIAFDYSKDGNNVHYLVSEKQCESMEQKLLAVANELAAQANQYPYNFQKELFLHDYICNSVEYQKGEPEEQVYTAYGALINGKAVCEGYSRAMQLLCKSVGIPCTLVSGEFDGTRHMWNRINPGDGWYHLDLTWDDQEILSHAYFNLTDEQIKTDHQIAPCFTELSATTIAQKAPYNFNPFPCDVTSQNYFVHEGLLVGNDYANRLSIKVAEADRAGKKSLEFQFETTALQLDFMNHYEKYAAAIQRKLGQQIILSNISASELTSFLYWE